MKQKYYGDIEGEYWDSIDFDVPLLFGGMGRYVDVCPKCHGKGITDDNEDCFCCDSTGYIEVDADNILFEMTFTKDDRMSENIIKYLKGIKRFITDNRILFKSDHVFYISSEKPFPKIETLMDCLDDTIDRVKNNIYVEKDTLAETERILKVIADRIYLIITEVNDKNSVLKMENIDLKEIKDLDKHSHRYYTALYYFIDAIFAVWVGFVIHNYLCRHERCVIYCDRSGCNE